MKKLSQKERAFLIRKALAGAGQRSRRRSSQSIKGSYLQEQIKIYGDRMPCEWDKRRQRVPVAIPREISLKSNFLETVNILNTIRDLVINKRLPIDLYFDHLEKIETSAALALTAEMFRCRQIGKFRDYNLLTGNYPKNPNAFEQLKMLGFFELLEIEDGSEAPEEQSDHSRFTLKFMTDGQVRSDKLGYFIDLFVKAIGSTIEIDEQTNRYLYAAIVEAMKNAREHAYKLRPEYQTAGHRWWLTADFNRATGEFSFILFDQGVGIPRTLTPTTWDSFEAMRKDFERSPSDSLLIEMATRPGRTSTDQQGRGKGFATMRKFVDACDDGELLIYSNRGHYKYSRSDQDRREFDASLGGTLVEWRVRHTSATVSLIP